MAKKALLIIAPDQFRDEEYFHTKEELEAGGVEVTTASSASGEITGMLGGKAKPDKTLNDVSVDEYDAVVFVGGVGASAYFNNEKALEIARKAGEKGKVLAAICIAPTVLANAGALKGRKATLWGDPALIENLKNKGGNYTGEPVTQDGNIITGDGPKSARSFGRRIAQTLKGE